MSEIQYFRLVFRQYYSQKGLRPPKSFTDITSKAERSDISYKYISTLTDARLREKLFLADVPFEDLPSKATRYAQILKRTDTTSGIFQLESSVNTCQLCGSRSHTEKDCMASPKNRRLHKKKMNRSYSRSWERFPRAFERNDRGRSRERYERGRSGSRTRYSSSERRSPYPYYRSYSRSGSRGRRNSRSYYKPYYRSRSNSGYRTRSNSGYRGRSSSREERYRNRDNSRGRYRSRRSDPDGEENYHKLRESSPKVRFNNEVRNYHQ